MEQRPIIFGTAGHIDHGKTTLTRALTRQDTDRLPEEKARGISIDLGFAHFTLQSGQSAALIDVPGHERFIRNMVAGVHGMDAVLLVVAADEGVMPQTREHLDILTLLGVKTGMTVITKADLVDDEWRSLVEETTREALSGTFLAEAPMVAVDAVSGRGMEDLQRQLQVVAERVRFRSPHGYPRLPIDRAFSVKGFGTVITGTLVSGRLSPEQAVELAPEGIEARIRSLEVHGQTVDEAVAGQRVAVNLGGVDRAQVHRGQVLSLPGVVHGVSYAVVQVTVLPSSHAIEQRDRVHCHIGTGEAVGRVYFYDRERAEPGETVFAEIRLESPLAIVLRDRFLLRSYSPVTTIAGGTVLEIDVRHRRREAGLIERLSRMASGSDADRVANMVRETDHPQSLKELAARCGLPEAETRRALLEQADLIGDEDRWWWSRPALAQWGGRIGQTVRAYHRAHPLRVGIPREQLRTELAPNWPARAFLWTLAQIESLVSDHEWVRFSDFEPQPTSDQARLLERIAAAFADADLHPKSLEAMAREQGLEEREFLELVQFLVQKGSLLRLEESVYIDSGAYERGVQAVRRALADGKSLGASELKEELGTNRRFAISFLELLDSRHITRRVGDKRMLAG